MPPGTHPTPRLVLFSGIGVDSRVYTYQRSLPVRLLTPEWIEPVMGESLADYSRRMAALVPPDGYDPPAPVYVGGLSFGGMIALEAARVMRPRPAGIILISSCFSADDLSIPVRLTGRLFGSAPAALLSAGLSFGALFVRVVGRSNRRQRRLLVQLLKDLHLSLTRWAGPAILDWKYEGELPCPVHHIHGGRDFVVPLESVLDNVYPPPDLVLPDAGHALNVTHAAACNRFILESMGQ